MAEVPGSTVLARRPGRGVAGQPVTVLANSFLVRFEPKKLFHYDVTFSPEGSKCLKRMVFNKMVMQYKPSLQSPPVFDGDNSVYSVTDINHKEFLVQLDEMDDSGNKRQNTAYRVMLKEASRPDLGLLNDFLKGKRGNYPHDVLQVLDLVLRECATNAKALVSAGRSFYSDVIGKSDIGGGIEAWQGFFMTLRPVDGYLALNIDMKANAFVKEQRVVDFISHCFRLDPRDLNHHLRIPDATGDCYRAKLKNLLKNMKLQTRHGNFKSRFKVSDLTKLSLQDLTFDHKGNKTSVVQYFKDSYNINLELQGFPALNAGKRDNRKYIPLELCWIVRGQNYTRKLNDQQYNGLSRMSCCDPELRKEETVKALENLRNKSRMYTSHFGIEINRNLTKVQARVLRPPKIQYGNGEICPANGFWNMIDKRMVQGREILQWGIVSFAPGVHEKDLVRIATELSRSCDLYGMGINHNLAFRPMQITPVERVESVIRGIVKDLAEKKSINLQLLVCILPTADNKPFYVTIKRLCEIDLGVITQCAKENKIRSCSPGYLANLILKINMKLGGTNAVISPQDRKKCKLTSDSPTVVIGVDISHPRPGDDISCSTAAVVGSMNWPEFSQYETVIRSQPSRQEIVEGLYWEDVDEQGCKTTGGIFKEMLTSFNKRTGLIPHRIMYYRDGVSDSQFEAVLRNEFESLQQACRCLGWMDDASSLETAEPANKRFKVPGKGPKISFIVVQKRHHTCFFPTTFQTPKDNVFPGTVVDTTVCHPTHFDFYMCSHQGVKGTSRPVHYQVLKDESGFTADEIQQFTHDMCYLYSRCTRSVSYVPPCYYAHLAAQRAQAWMDPEVKSSTMGSSSEGCGARGSNGTGSEANSATPRARRRRRQRMAVPVRPLPPLHENIKNTMFYI